MADCLRDLKRAVKDFGTHLAGKAKTSLKVGRPFECKRIAERSFKIPNGKRPGVYAFLTPDRGTLDNARIADIGKSQQACGVQRRITENDKEYRMKKNRRYPVTHCVTFTWPAQLHFFAPALESFLLDRICTRDNKRRRG